jgi:hypothetical protein
MEAFRRGSTSRSRPRLAQASLGEEARALIERCLANDLQQRPAFKEFVQRLSLDDYWEADGDSDEADRMTPTTNGLALDLCLSFSGQNLRSILPN